jgi:hypothetical protein
METLPAVLWGILCFILVMLCAFVNPSMKDVGRFRKQFMGIAFLLGISSLCSPNYVEFKECTPDPVSKTDYCTLYAVGLWGVCHYQDGVSEGCYTLSSEIGQPGKLYQCHITEGDYCLLAISGGLFFGIMQVFSSLAYFYLSNPARKYRSASISGLFGLFVVAILIGFFRHASFAWGFYFQIVATILSFFAQALTWASEISPNLNRVAQADQSGVIGVDLVPDSTKHSYT